MQNPQEISEGKRIRILISPPLAICLTSLQAMDQITTMMQYTTRTPRMSRTGDMGDDGEHRNQMLLVFWFDPG
jgi:hypothetical protein